MTRQQGRQVLQIFNGEGLHSEQAAQHLDLLLRAEALSINRNEHDIASAMTHDPAGGQLGNGGGLTNAGRSDKGNSTATLQQRIARHTNTPGDTGQRTSMRIGKAKSAGDSRHQFAG